MKGVLVPKAFKKVLFVTSTHLTSNPRLVKEAKALVGEGYRVHILFVQRLEKIVPFDLEILNELSVVTYTSVQWYRFTIYKKIFFKVHHLFFKWFSKFSKIQLVTDYAMDPFVFQLKQKARKLDADFVIGHNMPALPVIASLSERLKINFGFDIEDAYSFIESNKLDNPDLPIFCVEKNYLPMATYLTCASPIYCSFYLKQFNLKNEPILILNVSEMVDFQNNSKKSDRVDENKISLYWFSQTVGLNRGLQDIIGALNQLNSKQFELHIRGAIDADVKSQLLSGVLNETTLACIYFHDLVSTLELKFRNLNHDIGLALEGNTSINRSMCVSNKLFDYMASGLVIIASGTEGQSAILNNCASFSYLYSAGNRKELITILKNIIENKAALSEMKTFAKKKAEVEFNWNIEKVKFVSLIEKVLK